MFGFGKPKPSNNEEAKADDMPGFRSIRGSTVLVTGSSGLCGARLVEMLVERGAKKVVAFDLVPPNDVLAERFEAVQKKNKGKIIVKSGKEGDLTNDAAVEAAFQEGVADNQSLDLCFHVAALVGPFHDAPKYYAVNLEGTKRIIAMCKKYKVPKLIYSSSPSTRFTGGDITGQTEDELPYPKKWLALYAETKALGEMEVAKACDLNGLRTISVAPHQVYGPYDTLFLPKLLETAGNGRLRIFGEGKSKLSVCYVDNYAHGMMCGADALDDPNSPAMGKFYIVTDDETQYFWEMINTAVVAMGFTDLHKKFHLPLWLLYIAAYVATFIGWLTKRKMKLSPFTLKMLVIHRYFSIENAKRDLKYQPIVPFSTAWPSTVEWFKVNWLPKFLEESGKNKKD